MRNQRGSVILVGLLFCVGVAIVGQSFIQFLNSQNRQQSRSRLQEDILNLNTSVKMVYADKKNCQQNLTAAAWGTTLQGLKSHSQNNTLKLFYPTSGPVSGVLLGQGQIETKNNLKEMHFTNIKQIQASLTAYRMDLVITMMDSGGTAKATMIPFYVVTDASENLVSCFATSYPFISSPDPKVQEITMEDFLCSQLSSTSSEYTPAGQTCLPKPDIVGGN
jgi:hypothetical protein